ncbi:sterol desaturase family protein [Chitinophaga japonensis]|uniref:Sterol desaturase/sphingolipid hydroxylase (Fatty acid hydroxylase superfamily) n=1 Tax=Chitinophaga japonensis TaxID=104662 RepID=A0A562T6Q2_CHIJA|nr:sterol desaturase family protein [Chitinophaga japonensis]TWI88766.1 sterol desaturase/sphingolipid hydroxylase (fatty acid hydroxylase superfamily) [Chitinophaga japonensis]
MAPFDILYDEIISFLGIGALLEMYRTGDYHALLSLNGILSAVSPVIPFLLLIEVGRALVYKRFRIEDYKIPFLIFVANRFISRFISIAAIAFCIGLFEKYALFKTSFTWYWLIYGYVIWELAHFVYHYLGHKVRLFWCLHSTHHAPQSMNLSVTYAHFFLEAPYADVIRTSICILAGVNPPLLFFIMFIDGTWGAFIHVGENIIKDGRMGFLNKVILTPSHHRVHHARNPLYMDTNFCNLLNIWDKVFGTFQYEKRDLAIEYGISRPMNPNNFWDVYFGEFYALWKDIVKAPGIRNKLLYFVMPPGWSHTGDHKTARVVKQAYLAQQQAQPAQETVQPAAPVA